MNDDSRPETSAPSGYYVPASVIPSDVMTDSNGQNLRPGRSFIWPPIDPNAQTPTWIKVINQGTESCIFKAATSAVVGGGLGTMCGLFFGGYSNAVDKAVEMEGTAGMKLRVGMKEAAKSMRSYAGNFAKVGGIYVLAECTLERVRARHDLFNAIVGGCATGGALSASPKTVMPPRARAVQMAMGCGSFALFSGAIDYYMEYMN